MPNLLRIDSSARFDGSHSRSLGDAAEARWRAATGGTVMSRDLAAEPLPHVTATTVEGFYADPEAATLAQRAATRTSDALIAELKSANTLLITAPIYNFGVPASLKAWIDQVTRIGQTFAYEDGAFTGLVPANHAIVICAYGAGGYLNDGPFASADFLAPYLRFLLTFLGIEHVDVIGAEATTADEATVKASIDAAVNEIHALLPASAA